MSALVDIDASLQDFTYTFTCGSRLERLSFQTYKPRASRGEREEIISIYGDREVQRQINGHEAVIENEEELGNVHSTLLGRNSICGGPKSIRWKLYFARDINMKDCKDIFVGYCGLTLSESRHLSPHLYFRPEYQNMGIGKKVALCLSEKFLSHRDWLQANVSGLDITIHPMNEVCLLLKDKLFSDLAVENKNPADASGIWSKTHKFSKDKKARIILLRKFLCQSIKAIELFWESKMIEQVNKADVSLFDSPGCPEVCLRKRHLAFIDSSIVSLSGKASVETSGAQEDPSLESLDLFSKDLLRTIGPQYLRELLRPQKKTRTEKEDNMAQDLDAALQAFSYNFSVGSRREKLSFRTLDTRMSSEELEEILSIYGNNECCLQANGMGSFIKGEKELLRVRDWLCSARSLFGGTKSIRWRIYVCHDIDKDPPEEQFVGYIGLSLTTCGQLEPSIRLKPAFQQKRIGTKVMLCLLKKFLSHKTWLTTNVKGIVMHIHWKNEKSILLKQKLLSGCAIENKNLQDPKGLWAKRYRYSEDGIYRTLPMRKFVCNDIEVLETLWNSMMNQKFNWTELHLLNDSPTSEEATLVDDVIDTAVDSTMEDAIQRSALNKTMEKRLQEFAYSFEYKKKTEKLRFRTFQKAGQAGEVDTLFNLFGDLGTVKYACPETVLLDRDQAVLLRENLRELNSLSTKGGMVWKLHYAADVKNCEEAFIGIIRLDVDGGYLLPEIYLLSKFRKMGCGTKSFVCLMLKMFCNKSWLMRNFKGIRVLVNPFNAGALVLVKKLFGPFGTIIRNPEQQDGLWVVRRNGFGEQKEMKVKLFDCNGEAKLHSLWMSTALEVRQNKRYIWQDKAAKESVEVSQLAARVFFGLHELRLDPSEVKRLISKLRLQMRTNSAEALSVVSTFELLLPQLEESPSSFFLLFFITETGMQDFEVVLPHHRARVRREFIAFTSVEAGKDGFKTSVVESCLECVVGCVMELDSRTFDNASNMARPSVRGMWTTRSFKYNKAKRRTVKQRFLTSLALTRVNV